MFPFTIEEEASLLPLLVRKKDPIDMNVDCPFCGKKGKMNINFVKNVYRCVYCNTAGKRTSLYGRFYGISNHEAYWEILKHLEIQPQCNSSFFYDEQKKIGLPVKDDTIPEKSLDLAYTTLLNHCTLEAKHRKNLINRGLPAANVTRFFSVPAQEMKFDWETGIFEHIPGFYREEKTFKANFPTNSGIIIPIRSVDNYTVGLQIRLDKPWGSTRYLWFSSAKKLDGKSSGSPLHFMGNKQAEVLFITEGALKGTISYYLRSDMIQSILCVAGINNIKDLPKILEKIDPLKRKKIVLAYDMDKFVNHHVMAGEVALYNMLYQMGYKPGIYHWIEDKQEISNFYHGSSGNLIPILNNKKIIGFTLVTVLEKHCGFDFYHIQNMYEFFQEMKIRGLCYLNLCYEKQEHLNTFIYDELNVVTKKLGIPIIVNNCYNKVKKGLDDYLFSEVCSKAKVG